MDQKQKSQARKLDEADREATPNAFGVAILVSLVVLVVLVLQPQIAGSTIMPVALVAGAIAYTVYKLCVIVKTTRSGDESKPGLTAADMDFPTVEQVEAWEKQGIDLTPPKFPRDRGDVFPN